MSDIFYRIEHPGEAKVTEKMSRFLAFACPAESEEQARQTVKQYANLYHDARHVCWAYVIGPDRSMWQLNDNGEPSGTAGKPILGQINSLGLTDVVVIVVRYFGGIKLGTSGLIAAYRQAAREALEDAGKIEMRHTEPLTFTFPYISMNGVMKVVKGCALTVTEQDFDNTCRMSVSVARDDRDQVKSRLRSVEGVSIIESE